MRSLSSRIATIDCHETASSAPPVCSAVRLPDMTRYFHFPQLRQSLADLVAAYNFARRLRTLKGLTAKLDFSARWIHSQSAPANAGTKHLDWQLEPGLLGCCY